LLGAWDSNFLGDSEADLEASEGGDFDLDFDLDLDFEARPLWDVRAFRSTFCEDCEEEDDLESVLEDLFLLEFPLSFLDFFFRSRSRPRSLSRSLSFLDVSFVVFLSLSSFLSFLSFFFTLCLLSLSLSFSLSFRFAHPRAISCAWAAKNSCCIDMAAFPNIFGFAAPKRAMSACDIDGMFIIMPMFPIFPSMGEFMPIITIGFMPPTMAGCICCIICGMFCMFICGMFCMFMFMPAILLNCSAMAPGVMTSCGAGLLFLEDFCWCRFSR